jgi:hypothetical protein
MDGSQVAAPAPQAAPQAIDVEKVVGQYVKLRDKIKEISDRHADELKPFNEMRARLDGMLLQHLQTQNVKSMRTEAGTITSTVRRSATVEDREAFREYVTVMELWDLVDLRANAPAIFQCIEETGAPPPGVKTSQMMTLSVRRA